MNDAHLHVAMNHFPVVGAVIAAGILFAGIFKKNRNVQETALWLLIFIALLVIPVLLTGANAKEMIERLPGIDEEKVERHEKLAKATFGLLLAAGLTAVIQLYLSGIKKQLVKLIIPIAFLSVVAAGLAGVTANAGGKIRHSEFKNGIMNEEEELKPGLPEEAENKEAEPRRRKRKGRDH